MAHNIIGQKQVVNNFMQLFYRGSFSMRTSDAVTYFDGRRALAERLGISTQAVAKWGDAVPEGAAYKLQILTNGRLRVDPALYPGRWRRKAGK
jgi:hypothetical protein